MYPYETPRRQYERVAIYLRKSRKDIELELVGAEDTLERHRRILLELARHYGLTVLRIYQEVVSGDTIEGRPQMRQLLADVERRLYDAVIVHDIDRLGRGGIRDQGLILDTFKWSHCAIITPDKIYDLDLDMDEEAMEYKAQGARFEYRMIKKRLARGREASVREGKFIGHTAPYGYERYKLQGQKGWSLRPVEPQAQTVRDMYRWFLGEDCDRIGVSLIARRLNERGIPGPAGKDWTNCAVRSILANPEYAGFIRTKYRPTVKSMEAGELTVSRPRSGDGVIYPGLHEPIITQAQSEAAIEQLRTNKSRPGPKQHAMKNPLSGLVICSQCGRAMVRRPYGTGYPDTLMCPYTSCSCVSSSLEVVEHAILDSLRSWISDLSLDYEKTAASLSDEADLASMQHALDAAQNERTRLLQQRSRAYDLVEQGVYTPEIFTARMTQLDTQLRALEAQETVLRQQQADLQAASEARRTLLPNVRHVLDVYDLAETPEEKNRLLRSVLQKVTYQKTTRERSKSGSDMTITLHPRF